MLFYFMKFFTPTFSIEPNKIYDSGSIWIRMYGYYDPDGKWHETFNEYVYENIAQSPSNYSINTF